MSTSKTRASGALKKAFYTPSELAQIAAVHPSTVLNWIRSGRLYGVRLSPRVYRIPLASALRLLEPERSRPPRVVERPFGRVNVQRIERELGREHRRRRHTAADASG